MQLPELARVASIEERMGRVKASLCNCLDAMQWGGWIIPKGCASCADGRGWRRFEGHGQLSVGGIEKPTDPPSRRPTFWSSAHGYHRATGVAAPAHGASMKMILAAALMPAVILTAGLLQAQAQGDLPVLTQAAQVRKLTAEQSRLGYPVRLRGVISYNLPAWNVTFFHDSTAGIFLWKSGVPSDLRAGDLVEVRGRTGPGDFAPVVAEAQVRVVGKAPLPPARRFSVGDLLTGEEDSQWVEARGVVQSVKVEPEVLTLGIAAGSYKFNARIREFNRAEKYTSLVDAEVAVRGDCGTVFSDKRQLVGIQLFVPSLDEVHIEKAAPADPYALPILPTSGLLQFSPKKVSGHRLRVQGVVTFHRPGGSIFVQDASGSVVVLSNQSTGVEPGDRVDAVGFPTAGRSAPLLEQAVFRKIGRDKLPPPIDFTRATTLSADQDAELVRIQGRLIDQTFRGGNLTLTMQTRSSTFTAHLEMAAANGEVRAIPTGSLLEVTGVWSIESEGYGQPTAFRVLLRSAADIVVLKRPPSYTGRRVGVVLGTLAAIIFLSVLWVAVLRRRVGEQTETIRATLESTADGIMVVNSAGGIATYNRKFAEMWAIPDSVLESRDYSATLKFMASQLRDSEAFLARIRQVYADGEVQVDDVIEFKDGRVFERHSEPQRVKGKNVGRVWGFRNVTERRRAEEELHRSRQMLQLVLDNIPQRVFWKDRNSNYLGCNKACAVDAGLQGPEEIIGKNDFEFAWREMAELYRADDKLVMERASPKLNFEEPENNADGSLMWVRTSKLPLRDREGKVIGVIGTYEDITERKRAERALQERTAYLNTLIENNPLAIVTVDVQGRVKLCNPAFERLFLYPRHEIEGTNLDELVAPPESISEALKITGQCLSGIGVHATSRRRRKDGSLVDVEVYGVPLMMRGEIVGQFALYQDISARTQAEAALIEERHLLHTLMDNLPDTIYFKDRESRFTRINKALAKAFGLKDPAQAVGKTDFDFFTDEHSQQAFADEREIIRTGQPMLAKEEKETWPDGRETWASTTKMPLRDAHGNILGTFGVSRDITERRRAERVLEERTAYLNTLIEISPLGIITLDAQCRVQMCNPAFERLFLYRRAEIEGANLDELLPPPESVSEALELTAESLSGIAVHTTSRRRRKDGTLIDVEVHGVPLVMHGELVGQLGLYCDITERKRAEEAIRASEQRYRLLFERNLAGVCRATLDGRFLDCNDAYARILGYPSREEMLAQPVLSVYFDPAEREAYWAKLRERGTLSNYELRLRRKDGSGVWVLANDTLLDEEVDGQLVKETTLIDITERKQAETALIEERHLLHTLMDNLPDAIYFKDRESRLTRTNKANAKKFGLKDPAQAVGKADFDFFTDEHAQQAYADEQEIIRTGQPMLAKEEKETWPDGRETWVSTTKMPLREAQGQIVGTFGISRDVTERKRAEEALRESEEHFRRFIENVPLGVCRTTPDGRVLMANPALLRMLGYDSWQELASRNLEGEALEAGYRRSAFREQIEREGEVGGLEAAWKRRDGSVIFVRESARAFRADDGRVLYYDGIVEDVTERRRLGEQLRQAQKMEAVGCLAGGVAHDFNNLLTVVIGYSDLLLKKLTACDGMRLPVGEIKKAGERAASLTRQLLAFSRKQMLQPQILDLNSLLTNVDEMLRRMIGEDIELATHLPSGLGRVKADPGQIEQVIMNLAVNARDAMPQGGQLTLEAANVELDSRYASSHESVLPGHYVMIAMSDTGIGMDAETQVHIFEPFFTTKEQGKGTGLGLATVYGIVKQSGGSIRVYSEPGKGTTFKVYLPRIDQAVEVIAPTNVPVDEQLSRGSETILLAEDEEAVRSLVRGVLESTGYQVLETKGANDALEVGERHRKHIHLLLTDVVMPQMSGAELVKHLAPLHPETKVLYMSGYADHAVVRHGLLDPSTAFLQKPFTPDALALKVREVLDGAAGQGT